MYLIMYDDDTVFCETKESAQAYYFGLLSKEYEKGEIAVYKIASVSYEGTIED